MSELLDAVLLPEGGGYTPVRELRGGGMSRVFVAREEALGRLVVIKVLSPSMAEGLSRDRFAREIKVSASLQEPHIVPLLAAGQTIGGLPFYAMPFVQGESLRERLKRGTPLSMSESIGILRNIVSALAYAHRNGVVHRDIKPDNVLISSGTAVVTDFGIAKAIAGAKDARPGATAAGSIAGSLTGFGVSLGTPAYMAPEQATGDRVDARADLYSWGVIAYEMLSGRHPFADKTSVQKLITAHLLEPPPSVNWGARGVSPALGAIVMQCLAKSRDERPASAEEILAALDWVDAASMVTVPLDRAVVAPTPGSRRLLKRMVWVGAGAVVLVVAGWGMSHGGWSISRRASVIATDNDEPAIRLAVLPFEDLGDTAVTFAANGITDEVRSRLIALPALRVMAGGSSSQYQHTKKPLRQVANELHANYLLIGRVRSNRSGGRRSVRITPELIHVDSVQDPVSEWQGSFLADSINFLGVQSEIATKVASQLAIRLTPNERAAFNRRSTTNLAAWEALRRGQHVELTGSTLVVQHLAEAAYKEALRLDPNYAEAWAYLSEIYVTEILIGSPTPRLGVLALAAAQRAIQLAPDQDFSHEALANYYAHINSQRDLALTEYRAALKAAPHRSYLLRQVADLELENGQTKEGLMHLESAVAVDPRSPTVTHALAEEYARQRDFARAAFYADRAIALSPHSVDAIRTRAEIQLAKGDVAGAISTVRAGWTSADSAGLLVGLALNFDDLAVPDEGHAFLRLHARPEMFGGDRGAWAFIVAHESDVSGDSVRARAYADSAVAAYAAVPAVERNPRVEGNRAMMLAILGRREEAIRAANYATSVARQVGSKQRPLDLHLATRAARAYARLGMPHQAIGLLEEITRRPYKLTPEWVKLDSDFAMLKGNARFDHRSETTR